VIGEIRGRERPDETNDAIATALVGRLAEDPVRFGRRLTRAEVDKPIVDANLVDIQMKAFGQRDDWAAGRRSR
jgi:hypothetical protein